MKSEFNLSCNEALESIPLEAYQVFQNLYQHQLVQITRNEYGIAGSILNYLQPVMVYTDTC